MMVVMALIEENTGPNDVAVWLPAFATVVVSLIAAIFGPNFLNRRNANQIAKGTVSKDEASAAQTIQVASVSLIEEWRKIAAETRADAAQADSRADEAERKATMAEARAVHADNEIVRLSARVSLLEDRLRRAGIAPP